MITYICISGLLCFCVCYCLFAYDKEFTNAAEEKLPKVKFLLVMLLFGWLAFPLILFGVIWKLLFGGDK